MLKLAGFFMIFTRGLFPITDVCEVHGEVSARDLVIAQANPPKNMTNSRIQVLLFREGGASVPLRH
jgi:hypothetical protein